MNIDNQTPPEDPEAELMNLIVQGDEQAFERLYHRLYSRLFRFVARMTRRPELIEEIINDTMYVVWEKASTYNRQCRPSTWIFGIAFNKARQSLRNAVQGNTVWLDDMEGDAREHALEDNGPLQIELDDWLEFALDCLSPEQRAVIELTYYQELHYNEIAELMECSENTIKTRMHYARKKLAAFLNDKRN
ncbi:RNA polymerase sigma factor [Methylomicrobium sp. Wu6]|uniref:RNA polymerase sigma factor n=1 Tax=Methylomicrobium sp. Wu6 TaxID=3107928 RepID=UPI002DD6976B|nr:RNA polymerase sigma factor [Methylomicrobium sp. Wu6]